MRKISEMYEYSGGTDYRHTCHECKNCITVKSGSRTADKCRVYGITDDHRSDWKRYYIACRHFDKPPDDQTVMERKRKIPPHEIEGQMSIMDFLE